MVSNSSSFKCLPHSPPCKRRGDALSPRPWKRHRLEPLRGGNDTKGHRIQRHTAQLHRGMLDIPIELLLMISTHLDIHDLRALAVTSRSMCGSLLPAYLRRRGLVLMDGNSRMELLELTGYASLGLRSAVHIFQSPEEMYCSIPCDTQEAQSAIGFLTRFLLEPSNTCNLRDFHFTLRGSNPRLLTSEFFKMHQVLCTLPLTRLGFSGYSFVDYLPPSTALRSRLSPTPLSLTTFTISSDCAFAPGLLQTTLSVLRHSPIQRLTICMVSLKPSQWSTLLGELHMASLENIDLEGDIPRPALIRFLTKNKGLESIRIRCNALTDRIQPRRSRRQSFLPDLLTLDAPLAVCCDIAERMDISSSIYEMRVEMNQLQPQNPSFRRLLETLRRFQKLKYLALLFVQSSSCATPQDYVWDQCPAHELTQIRSLGFFRTQDRLSPGDMDMICAHIRSFPMVETVFVVEGGDSFRMEVLDSVRKAKPSLRTVTVLSGSVRLKWTTDDHGG